MDTLIYSSSLFLIPINIAAIKNKYILMNVFIGLLLTSWAHHSNKHISDKISIYDSLDNYMCYVAISITLLYALLYSSSLQIMLYIPCLLFVYLTYQYVESNINYCKRGLENWDCHVYHILMHIFACLGFITITLDF